MPKRPLVRSLNQPRRGYWGRAAIALAAASLAGCGGPCADLSEQVCASAGSESTICRSLRVAIATPHAGDSAACVAGVAYLDELKRGR